MSQDNVQIVQRAYELFGRGDIDGLLAMLDPEIVWKSSGPAELPTAGTRRGREGARGFFQAVNNLYEFERFEPGTFVSEGERVVVLGMDVVKVKATGVVLTEEWAHVFTIRAGRIAEFQEYIDTAAVVAALRSEQSRA